MTERFWAWLSYQLPKTLVAHCYTRVMLGALASGERLNDGKLTAVEAAVLWEKYGDWPKGDSNE